MTRDRDAGQVTAFAAVLMVALFALAGLVLDGGRYFTASRDAHNVAAGAARAGAQGVSEDSLRDPAAALALDPQAAYDRAQAFLTKAGATGTVAVGLDSVTVTVTDHVDPLLLGIVGIGDRTITATETATPFAGR